MSSPPSWPSPGVPPTDGPVPDGTRRARWPLALGLVAATAAVAVTAGTIVVGTRPATDTAPAVTVSPSATAASRTTAPPVLATPTASGSLTPVTTPTPDPTYTLTASPTPAAPAGPNQSLRTNGLYAVDLGRATVRCKAKVRRPKPALADEDLAPYLRTVVRCLDEAYTEPLAEVGFTLESPRISTYAKSVSTPCGKFGQKGAPAYYCSASATIYWPRSGDDGREAYTYARLGYVGLVAHEYGHHLQATTGMLSEYAVAYQKGKTSARNALSRRLELQATCFEGVFLRAARADLDVTAYDRSELRTWHGYTGDEDPPSSRKPDHGTSKAQIRWLNRGLDSGDLGRCNTWSAPAKDVT